MRHGVLAALAVVATLAAGCADDVAPLPPVEEAAPTTVPAYDASLEPAAAVLPLVPEAATTLRVTDFTQVRDELGLGAVGTAGDGFWARAEVERPMVTEGVLRGADADLAEYGFGQADVVWEAVYDGGWVVRLREGVDTGRVQEAVAAGVGPLDGASVDAANHLVSVGAAADPEQSWAADELLREEVVDLPANATYVERGCGPADGAGDERNPLAAWSVQFEGTLATARLGPGRTDLFERMRFAQADPGFAAAFTGGVADPLTGRIGFVMRDPAQAAQLALTGALPLTTCT